MADDGDAGPKPGVYLPDGCASASSGRRACRMPALPRLEAKAGLPFDYAAGQGGEAFEGAVG